MRVLLSDSSKWAGARTLMARDLTNAVNDSTSADSPLTGAEAASMSAAVCGCDGGDGDGCGGGSDSPAAFLTSVTQPGIRSTGSADRARASTPAAAAFIRQSTASGAAEHWDAALTTANGTTAAPPTCKHVVCNNRSDATTAHKHPDRFAANIDDDMFVFSFVFISLSVRYCPALR